jgi:hypothetical protein
MFSFFRNFPQIILESSQVSRLEIYVTMETVVPVSVAINGFNSNTAAREGALALVINHFLLPPV